jgi:hypothetical protein
MCYISSTLKLEILVFIGVYLRSIPLSRPLSQRERGGNCFPSPSGIPKGRGFIRRARDEGRAVEFLIWMGSE